MEPTAKPSGSFETFDLGHQAQKTRRSHLTFFDVSGKARRARWPAYFSDCHAFVLSWTALRRSEARTWLRLLLPGYERK